MIKVTLKPDNEWRSDPLNSNAEPDFTGYYLNAIYTEILFGNPISAKLRVDFDKEGKGLLTLPDIQQIYNREIFLEVYSEYGNVVRERFSKIVSDSVQSMEIEVKPEPKDEFNAVISKYRISGKLLDIENCIETSGLQFVIFGSDNTETPSLNDSYILSYGKTSKDGYFAAEIPKNPDYKNYFLVIELDEERFYPLRSYSFEEAGEDTAIRIEDKQIISIQPKESAEASAEKKDDHCSCKESKINASGLSQSSDGNCVSFTAPNRTIDEFSFYHVVRTTEPEIKSTFLSSRDVLDIYSELEKSLKVIPPKLISQKVIIQLPQFKTETVFRSVINSAAGRAAPAATGTSAMARVANAPAGASAVLAGASVVLKADDFRNADAVRFAELFETKKSEIKRDFDAQKKSLEQEEQNINNLIAEITGTLKILRENPDHIESNATISDLLYRLEIIRVAIKNYIKSCELFKAYFEDDLNSKMLDKSDVNYVRELDRTIKEFRGFESSLESQIKQLSKIYADRHTGRKYVSVEDEIDWDNSPTVFHNTTIAHGHILHFKQVWKNDGYSLGKVLQSIPLMPGQQKNIAVLEWNRTNIASRTEEQTTAEQLSNSLSRDRDVSEVMNSAFSENIRASSQVKSKTSGWSVGASVGFPVGPVMIGISGGYSSSKSSASSTATQDASRNLSANSMNNLRDNIQQSASSLRSQRSTVVQTVSQNESFSITTEVIANYNHCHALTMQYFEILRHLLIETKLADVQECLFVPLPMSEFTTDKILRWKNTLSGVLLDEDLREGLNAVDRIENEYKFVDFPTGRYADEIIDYIDGELTISFAFTRPLDQADADGKENLEALKLNLAANPIFNIWGQASSIINNYMQLELKKQKERDAVFESEIVPKIIEGLVDSLVISKVGGAPVDGFDFTLIDSYENKRITGWDALFKYANQGRFSEISSKNRPLRIRFRSVNAPLGFKRSDIEGGLKISFNMDKVGLTGVTTFPSENKIRLHSFKASYSTQYYNGVLTTQLGLNDDIKPGTGDSALVRTPLNAAEKRNPRDEDRVLAAKLISHLNEYLEFYHKQIWLSMDPNRLFSLVDGFIAPNSGGRSVASVCENQVVGVVGNNLVLKVAPGYKLDPTYRLADDATLLDHYQPTTPMDPFHISFPTSGIYAEAVMGACNSCEKIDDTRYWKWEEHPIPNKPTEIQPISTDSRYVDPGNLQTKDLATPVINIQNAPEAPAPTGLAGVFDLMGKAGIFNDMTGLAGNQDIVKHALTENAKTLQTTQANAVEGMKVAKQIYDSQQANKDVQRKMEEIDKAFPPDGTPEQRAENARLKSALLNKQIGVDEPAGSGGSTDISQAASQLSAIDELVKSGKLSNADGEALKSSVLSGVTNRTNGVINNPAIQSKIEGSGRVEYTSPGESLKLEDSSDDADPKKQLAKFLVHFRRPDMFLRTNGDATESKVNVKYAGHFGFDWLRDEYIYPVEMVLSDLDGNPLNTLSPLVQDVAALKTEYLKDVVSPITPYEKEYYPAWLSIFPPRGITGFNKGSRMHEQGVKLSLEIEELESLEGISNTLIFKSSDPLISISPAQLSLSDLVRRSTSQNKVMDRANGISKDIRVIKDIITIKSGKGLLADHVEVKVIAKGSDKELEVGKLMIYNNYRIPKAEIVMVKVSYDDVNVNLDVKYHDILKNQAFNQALIRAEIVADEKFILNNLDATDADVTAFKANYPDGDRHDARGFFNDLLALYNKFGAHRIDPANPPSMKRTIMFITNQQSNGAGGIAESSYVLSKFVWGNSVIVYNQNLNSNSSFVHEICHSLSLPHIFSKALSDHKFYRGYTDNYMDYTTRLDGTAAKGRINNVHQRLFLFKWQWDIMRQDQSLNDD